MTKFEVGKTYKHSWIGESDAITEWLIVKRTAQTVTIKNGDKIKTCRIIKQLSEWEKAECIYPFGQFSMAPTLRANQKAII